MKSGTSGMVAEPPPPIPIPGASVIIEHDGQLRVIRWDLLQR